MFKEAGLSGAADVFDELIAFSQAMAKGEKTGFLTLNFDWLYWPLFKMNGIELLTPDLKKPAFNTPQAIAVLDRLAKATDSGGINKIAWTGRWVEPNGAFAGGTVGMLHAHSASYFFVKGQGRWINPDTLGAVQAPGGWSTPTNHGFAHLQDSKNPDLAFALVKHMTSNKWATAACGNPARADRQHRGRQGRARQRTGRRSAGGSRAADPARANRQDDGQLAAAVRRRSSRTRSGPKSRMPCSDARTPRLRLPTRNAQ